MSDVQCPCTLALHFPSEIYRSTGSSKVLPELVKSLDLPNVRGIQFMPNGIVRVTYKEPAQCDAALASGVSFRGAPLRTAPVDSRTRLVYVRDLPVEVPNDGLKVFLRAFGVVHSVVEQTHPGMPNVYTGKRVVKVTLSKDLPSSARVSGFDVRFWYQGQPRVYPVCRSYGHRVKDCPFNGVCRRCRLPEHMARECPSRRSTVERASAAPSVPEASSVPVADPRMSEDDEVDDPDYVPSTASEPGSCSGDDTVIQWSDGIMPGRKGSYSESDTSIFVFCDEGETESTVDPVPGKPVIASAASTPAVPVGSGTPVSASAVSTPVLVSTPAVCSGTPVSASAASTPVFVTGSGTPVSASAGPTPASVPVKPSVPVSGRKKPPPPAVAPSPTEPSQSQPSFWDRTRRRCFAFGGVDAAGESISLEFGTLTRSILRDSSTFEIDRFYKYRDRLVCRPYQSSRNVPNLSLRAGAPLKFPQSSK